MYSKIIGLFMLATISAFVFYMQSLPQKATLQNEVNFIYNPETVFKTVSRITSWPRWTVWNIENDPTLKNKFSGTIQGSAGTVWEWQGEKIGNGKITFTRVEPPSLIEFDWELRPNLIVHNQMTVQESGVDAKVTWKSEIDLGKNFWERFQLAYTKTVITQNIQKSLSNLKNRFMPGTIDHQP